MKNTIVLLLAGLLMAAALFAADVVHVVKKGETLSAISHKYHVPVADILRHNGLSSASAIKAGQRLKIPSPTAAKTAPAKPKPSATAKPAPSAARPATAQPETAAVTAAEKMDTIMPEASLEKPDSPAQQAESAKKQSRMSTKAKFFILFVVQTVISALLSYVIALWVINRSAGYKRGA